MCRGLKKTLQIFNRIPTDSYKVLTGKITGAQKISILPINFPKMAIFSFKLCIFLYKNFRTKNFLPIF